MMAAFTSDYDKQVAQTVQSLKSEGKQERIAFKERHGKNNVDSTSIEIAISIKRSILFASIAINLAILCPSSEAVLKVCRFEV